jgi:hypothetical protein
MTWELLDNEVEEQNPVPQGAESTAAMPWELLPEQTPSENAYANDKIAQQYAAEDKTPEQIKAMSRSERAQYVQDLKTEGEYLGSAGFTKQLLSNLSLGGTEHIDALKPQEYENQKTLGGLTGEAIPFAVGYWAISLPFKILEKFTKYSSWATKAAPLFFTGSALSTAKQAIKGEGVSALEAAEEGASFVLLDSALKGIVGGYKWLKSLSLDKQKKLLSGSIPDNLSPNEYKFYEENVVPEIRKNAETEYKQALKEATEKNELEYRQKMANVKAEHENNLLEEEKNQSLNKTEYEKAQNQYKNKLKQAAAEYQVKAEAIEKENQKAIEEFQSQQKDFELMQARQNAVLEATQEDFGKSPYVQSPTNEADSSLKNQIGNVVSQNKVTNTTNAGSANIEGVKANDSIDYDLVRLAYNVSDDLNAKVNQVPTQLVQQLRATAENIKAIPEPSPPQKQLLSVVEKILDKTQTVDEFGNITGMLEINNRILQEQAKSLRYFMDFNFEHGNTRGIFSPTVRQIENAVENGAALAGNKAAVRASQEARSLYAEWADLYDNPYIRPYRDTRNFDYSKIFKGSLDVDEFNMLDKVLSRSNAGQQLSASTKRALVEKHLGKFIDNPHGANPDEFITALNELSAVISPHEKTAIQQTFVRARKAPPPVTTRPQPPKVKELPQANIPLFKEKREVPPITQVKIPLKQEVKPTSAMKLAAQEMKITPEKAMQLSKTPTGLKKLRADLGEKVFEDIGKYRVRDIYYGGNVKKIPTGKELKAAINKSDNYSILSEILGEKETADLLEAAEKVGDREASIENIQKIIKKVGVVKTFLLFGII